MSDNKKNLGPELSRKQALLALSSVLSGGLLGSTVYADVVRNLLGRSNRESLDKITHPANAMIAGQSGTNLILRTTGLPDHDTGVFPNPGCPGPIRPTVRVLQFPREPKLTGKNTPLMGWIFGVAINGVVMDQTGPWYQQNPNTGYNYEVLSSQGRRSLGIDFNNAHTQPTGEYHYHGRPVLVQKRIEDIFKARGEKVVMCLIGFAADGFPIYAPYGPKDPNDLTSPVIELRSSYRMKTGTRPSGAPGKIITGTKDRDYTIDGTFVQDYEYISGLGELDECNGRFGVTPEYPNGTYYYVATDAFPFIPRFWKGTPDKSFYHVDPGTLGAVPKTLSDIYG